MLNFNRAIDTNYPRSKIPMILTMLDLLYVLNLSNTSFTALLKDETFPIIDLNGQMLGLIDMRNTIKGAPNVLTAVGITEMKKTVEILSNGQQKPFFGIHGTDVNDQANAELGVPKGVFLTSVEMNSPAMLAGLRSGDVITAIDGEAVGNYKEFIARLLDGAAERNAQITLMRLGMNGYEEMAVEAALRPVFDESTQEEPERGRNQALD
jgi:predicted metalloprotease with PDZ domain